MIAPAQKTRREQVAPVLWSLVALVVAFFFFRAAAEKLASAPAALKPFVEFGWPLWAASLTAEGEILGALALIIPATRALGGILLTAIMIGAACTNIANGHPDYLWVNALLICGSLVLTGQALSRRRRNRAAPPRSPGRDTLALIDDLEQS